MRPVDAEVVERLHDVGIGLARGGDAEAGVGAVDDHLVEPVGARESQRRVKLVALQPLFLVQWRVGKTDMQTVRRHFEVLGQDDGDAVGVDEHGRRSVDGLGDGLEGDPTPGIARQRPADEAKVQYLLDVGGIEHRNLGVHEGVFGLARQGRGLAYRVVAGHHQNAAVFGRARVVAVLEHVARAVDAGSLAVPHGEDTVVFGALEQVELLRAPNGGGRQVLVDAGLEYDVVVLEELLGAPRFLVDAAERRAAVARDEAGGIQSRQEVPLALHDGQPYQGLGSAQVDAARRERVLILERDVEKFHRVSP